MRQLAGAQAEPATDEDDQPRLEGVIVVVELVRGGDEPLVVAVGERILAAVVDHQAHLLAMRFLCRDCSWAIRLSRSAREAFMLACSSTVGRCDARPLFWWQSRATASDNCEGLVLLGDRVLVQLVQAVPKWLNDLILLESAQTLTNVLC